MLLAATATSSTTSIPTWLAVLAPVLTVVVGGLLGWLAASRTAERNAALARQDEQRRWNRERRDKAYAALLERRNQLVDIRRAWAEGDDQHELGFDMAAVNEEVRQILDAQQSLTEALAMIELVGTPEAVELARTWVLVLGERRVRGEEELFGDPVEREKDWRDQFVALIRKELGVDD